MLITVFILRWKEYGSPLVANIKGLLVQPRFTCPRAQEQRRLEGTEVTHVQVSESVHTPHSHD